jgi:hypothetical protein
MLDSTATGIAEWILPLVLAANLKRVDWVRPSSELQIEAFPLGTHQYHVGAWMPHTPQNTVKEKVSSFIDLDKACRVRVDLPIRYYVDDDDGNMFAPTNELLLPRPLSLSVSELPDHNHTVVAARNEPWALDVCLDYIACRNPFLTELQELNPGFCQALVDSIHQSILYKSNSPSTRVDDRRHQLASFRTLLVELLQKSTSGDGSNDSDLLDQLIIYYPSPQKGKELLERLLSELLQSNTDGPQLVTLATLALPNLAMPHASHFDKAIIQQSMQSIETELATRRQDDSPFCVTIARSSVDGFTPESLVEELQHGVLERVHRCYCTCQREFRNDDDVTSNPADCRFQIVLDYGKWEGSSL